ncbi:glutathione S-transferase family protein [Myxococcota bacterium]|nr:glutathione S-transferase family protein [Myxococcota bacterium]
MIDFYGFITTMSWRAGIALEELGLDYRFHGLHLGRGEHRTPEHAARNPMQKVPVIVDHAPTGGGAPITVFESGAILLYLAEKTGRLLPTGTRERAEHWTWFFWIVASFGQDVGLCGAAFHRDPRYRLDKQTDYGKTTYDHFTNASIAAHHKLDARLAGRDFLCGREPTLADIAAIGSTVPLALHAIESLDGLPNLARWYARMRSRPAVERGLALGRDGKSGLPAEYEAALFDDGWEKRA